MCVCVCVCVCVCEWGKGEGWSSFGTCFWPCFKYGIPKDFVEFSFLILRRPASAVWRVPDGQSSRLNLNPGENVLLLHQNGNKNNLTIFLENKLSESDGTGSPF